MPFPSAGVTAGPPASWGASGRKLHPSLTPPLRPPPPPACRSDSGAASFLGGLWEAVRQCQQDGWKVASIPQVWIGRGLVVGPGVDQVWHTTAFLNLERNPEAPSPSPTHHLPQPLAQSVSHVMGSTWHCGQYTVLQLRAVQTHHHLPASSINLHRPAQVHSPFEARVARGTAHDLSRLDVPPAPPAGIAEEQSPVRVAALLRKVGGCGQVWKVQQSPRRLSTSSGAYLVTCPPLCCPLLEASH